MRPRKLVWGVLFTLLLSTPSTWANCPVGRVVRVITFNTWGLPKPFLTRPERFRDLVQILPSLQADVIAFQETFTDESWFLENVPNYPYMAKGPRETGPTQKSSGLLLISRWPIVKKEEWVYSVCSSVDCFSNKGILYVRLEVEGVGQVDIFNTHMNAPDFGDVRAVQIEELGDFVHYFSGPRPLLVLGDFNFSPNSGNYTQFVNQTRLRDSYREHVLANPGLPPVDRLGLTYDGARNDYATGSSRIDYVWVRDDDSDPICILKSRLIFDQKVNGSFLSDHFGVMTDLVVSAFR